MFRATQVVRTTSMDPSQVADKLKGNLDPWRPFGSWFGPRKFVGRVHLSEGKFSVTRQLPYWNSGVRLWLRGKIEKKGTQTVVTGTVGVHPNTKIMMFSVLAVLLVWFGIVIGEGVLGSNSLQLVGMMVITIGIYFCGIFVFGPVADGGAQPLVDWLDQSLAETETTSLAASPNPHAGELVGHVNQS